MSMHLRVVFRKSLLLVLCFVCAGVCAQDTTYRVSLILPFQCESSIEKFDEITNAHDLFSANRVRFNDDAVLSLDFYQGVIEALKENPDSIKIDLHVYDSWNSDSVTTELLKKPQLKTQDFIIGSVSSSTAKLVAGFCKANKILNIQPFTPSKSLTSGNPYHLKLAPTIDSHIDNLFQSVLDSFDNANIIIYTPKTEKSYPLAQRFDSLFATYNQTAETKYTVSLLNITDQTVNGKKTTLEDLISDTKTNVLIITSYDEPFVQSALRTVMEKNKKKNIVVYGFPTWLNGEILRLDYINELHTRISDAFWVDSTNKQMKTFSQNYSTAFSAEPSRYSYLGFDVMSFLLRSVKYYGKDFLESIITQRYTGAGYKFDITKVTDNSSAVNYYENNHVNVLKVEDYQLKRVW